MASRIRLITLIAYMLIGAVIGVGFVSPMLLSYRFGYDHGFGEGQRCDLAAGVLGALAGLGWELTDRRLGQLKWRFSVRELLLATTMATAFLGIAVALLKWINSPWNG